jgi:hypothetical protein
MLGIDESELEIIEGVKLLPLLQRAITVCGSGHGGSHGWCWKYNEA